MVSLILSRILTRSLFLARETITVEFNLMICDHEIVLPGHFSCIMLDFLVFKLADLSAYDTDKMVVMLSLKLDRFVSSPSVSEIPFKSQVTILEEL